MTFTVAAEAYDRFMGHYSAQLAPGLADSPAFGPGCESWMSVVGQGR